MKIFFIKFFLILFSIILLISCTQPIVFKNLINEQSVSNEVINSRRKYLIDENISENFELIWSNITHGSFSNSTFAVFDKYLLVNDLSGRIYFFDRINGKLIGFEKFSGEIKISPIISSFRLFIPINRLEDNYFSIISYDLLNGKILSEERIKGAITDLIKNNDGFIVVSNLGEVIQFNDVGTILWKNKFEFIITKVGINKNIMYITNDKKELFLFDLHSREIKYKKIFEQNITSEFYVDGNNCFFGDEIGNLYSLNFEQNVINWKYKSEGKIISTPIANTNYVFICNLKGEVICLDKLNGKMIWKIETKGLLNSSPILFKNILVISDNNRKVYLIEAKTGKILNTVSFERRVKSSPFYYDGIIYFGSDRGLINAYKITFN